MFASGLYFERAPLSLSDLLPQFLNGIQDGGGFAAIGIFLWLCFGLPRMHPTDRARIPAWQINLFSLLVVGSLLSYITLAVLRWPDIRQFYVTAAQPFNYTKNALFWQDVFLTVGGACAWLAVLLPFAVDSVHLRVRRIFAIAKLSFKEALRRRILYVFSMLLLIFLFASWFVPYKPESQVRTYVAVIDIAMTWLLLLASAVVASFSIPADIRQQTIHTILTKPVERFEVILGRFLGFASLMTLVLITMTGISLLYIVRGVDPEAAAESLKAREPQYGDLTFRNTTNGERGDSVGREWEYRSYISKGRDGQEPTAVWIFPAPSASVAERKPTLPCEFGFDIYRTTKGDENKGVTCAFICMTAKYVPGTDVDYRKKLQAKQQSLRRAPNAEAELAEYVDELAEEYGYFEDTGKDVTDYHTQVLDLPRGLLRNASKVKAEDRAKALRVEVRCESPTQYVGMAKYDLYLRLDDPESGSERRRFAYNFFKGSVGLWLRMCLVIGVGVSLSTYLSGVISLLVTGLLYLGGKCTEFIQTVGQGTNVGGGPLESLYRLASRQNMAAQLEKTATVNAFSVTDQFFRFAIRRVLNLIPDVDRFDLSNYVAEGFNIPPDMMLGSLQLLIQYLVPCALLGYYLLKWREIASSN